jgi:hypothetical protein
MLGVRVASLSSEEVRSRFRDTLAIHQADLSPLVYVHLPVQTLADVDGCQTMAEALTRFAGSWNRHVATPNLWQMLPATAGLYMFVWIPTLTLSVASGTSQMAHKMSFVLYIGEAGAGDSAGSLQQRYRAEYSRYVGGDPEQLWEQASPGKLKRQELLRRYLTLVPLEYWFLEVEDRRIIRSLERRLIRMINPPLVLQHRVGLSPPRPAF